MEIHVIKSKKNIERKKLRVCAYARVSTEAEEQENSLENQITHYKELINNNINYEFINVYYDFGISGFKENRPGFQKMMQDARNGKIDLIITKSISRFARNTVTILKAIRELKELGVGIFFELQNINTLTESGELLITIMSAFAQAESENYSSLAKLVYKRKYEKGIPVHYLERSFGYKKDNNGNIVLDKEEAKWVKQIYEMIADGYSLADVKNYLNAKDIKTTKGASFENATVLNIVESEIYKGDYIMHKYYVNDDRKLVRNNGDVDAWYIKDDHKAIVSKKLWQKAQDKLNEKREYLNKKDIVKELNDTNYPYIKKIYCAKCGYPLIRRVYSNGNRINWCCSGQIRYSKSFCKGINVPDRVIKSFGNIKNNIYISKEDDEYGKTEFNYISENTWKRRNNKKKEKLKDVPKLNIENYPYYKKIYCSKCGSRLVRFVQGNGNIFWICNGNKRKGKKFCGGIRVPDNIIRSFGKINEDIFIERKDDEHGKKCYCYTSKENKK